MAWVYLLTSQHYVIGQARRKAFTLVPNSDWRAYKTRGTRPMDTPAAAPAATTALPNAPINRYDATAHYAPPSAHGVPIDAPPRPLRSRDPSYGFGSRGEAK
eukprot:7378914-Prymnesium_polylepis.1